MTNEIALDVLAPRLLRYEPAARPALMVRLPSEFLSNPLFHFIPFPF